MRPHDLDGQRCVTDWKRNRLWVTSPRLHSRQSSAAGAAKATYELQKTVMRRPSWQRLGFLGYCITDHCPGREEELRIALFRWSGGDPLKILDRKTRRQIGQGSQNRRTLRW